MTRSKNGKISKNRHRKVIKISKGYRGRSKNCFRISIQKVQKGLQYSYISRKNKKRIFRSLWIQRINSAASIYKLSYSEFISKIIKSKIKINRKMLSEISIYNPVAFQKIISKI